MYSIHRQKYKKIISMLVERRKAAGITQKQLASKIYLRQVIISKIETLGRRIDLLELINYCGGINVPFLQFASDVSEKILKENYGKDKEKPEGGQDGDLGRHTD